MERPEIDTGRLAAWTGGKWQGTPPPVIRGVAHDSRSIHPGMLFVAIEGEHSNGHAYVPAAFAAGAAAAVVAEDLRNSSRPCLLVNDTRQALTRMAAGYRKSLNATFIGVTGSAGKTTVKDMITHLLLGRYKTGCTKGNWNNELGLPLSLLAMPRDARYGVFEVGTNHPGEIARLCKVLLPHWGVLTVVGPAHIENFGTEKAILEEKTELLRCLPENGKAFINADCRYAHECKEAGVAQKISVSVCGRAADYQGGAADAFNGLTVTVAEQADALILPYCGPPGRAHIRNALQAVAVARAAGLDWVVIAERLSSFCPSAMRWQQQQAGGIEIINDAYNANPLSMNAALETLRQSGKSDCTWLVLGDMLELGEFEQRAHTELGRIAAETRWRGMITVGERARWIAAGAISAGMKDALIQQCETATEAAGILCDQAVSGESIFLKGSRAMKLEKIAEKLCCVLNAPPAEGRPAIEQGSGSRATIAGDEKG